MDSLNLRKASGAILFLCMVLILTLTAIVLASLQNVFLFSKAINQMIVNQQSYYALESISYRLMKNTVRKECVVTLVDPNQLTKIVKKQGCDLQHKYRYLYSDLGNYPCHQMDIKGRKYGSEHFLLTVVNAEGDILQIRYARRNLNSVCERKESIMIKEGILSWRFLPKYEKREIESPS